MSSELRLAPNELDDWADAILREAGASSEAAAATARALVNASQRGLDSHGVVFLHFYLPRLRAGTTDGAARPEIIVDLPSLALVDGHDGLGAFVASFAMDVCCTKAEQTGAAAVAVRNSSHFGAASYYAELAAHRGCIGIVVSNSDPGMAPAGALAPILGTNPLAIAAPGSSDLPTPSLDIASSVVAQGRIILASRAGKSIPSDWAIGRDGRPTEDPDDALSNSVLPMGGHKGFALAFMIDVLSACLSGALISPDIKEGTDVPGPQGTGHFLIAVRVEAIRDWSEYEKSLKRLADRVHSAPRTDWAEPFMIPGEREAHAAVDRAGAIPLSAETVGLLRSLGDEYGVEFPG